MDAADKLSTCLASEDDGESAPTCRSAAGDHFAVIIYTGNAHGMDLFGRALTPDPAEVIADFVLFTLNTN